MQANLLANGKVLVVGGDNASGPVSSAEIYDPASGTWSVTASMSRPRAVFSASVLTDGRVLAVGGYTLISGTGTSGPGSTNSAEIYDPVTGLWAATQNALAVREDHTATVLADGRVIIAGGQSSDGTTYATAEVYSPCKSLGVYTCTLHMQRQRLRSWEACYALLVLKLSAFISIFPSSSHCLAQRLASA